jgi:long-chain acyl-CoA synthetase
MIISGGVNIYPQEVENALLGHPSVLDAAVFGIPHEEMGEQVKAVVQTVDGTVEDGDLVAELNDFLRARLASFKLPRSIDLTDELPRHDNGKLYKRLLRDRYLEAPR